MRIVHGVRVTSSEKLRVRTGQHTFATSTTTAAPLHTPHTSTLPVQHAPRPSSTGTVVPSWRQHSPSASKRPESQQSPYASRVSDAHSAGTAQVLPTQPVRQVQASFAHVPRALQPCKHHRSASRRLRL